MELFQLLGLAVLVLAVLLFLYYYKQRWPVSNFPPGPTGLPIIGTALATGCDFTFNRTASELVNSYGNVCSFMLGVYNIINSSNSKFPGSQVFQVKNNLSSDI